MQVQTTRLGQIEILDVSDDEILEFPHGLPGFEDQRSFVLIEDKEYFPLRWLQAIDDPAVHFVAIDPALIMPGYRVELAELDLDCLELTVSGEAELLCILVAQDGLRSTTVNLKAPLVINRMRRRGKQVILTDERYPLRYPAFSAEHKQPSMVGQ